MAKVIRKQVNRDQAERLNALGWYVVLTTKQKRPGGHSFGTHVIAKNVDVDEFNRQIDDFINYAWGKIENIEIEAVYLSWSGNKRRRQD